MKQVYKSTRVWIAKGAAAVYPELVVWAAAAALLLAPFTALVPSASAASFVNTAVPSNHGLFSGFIQHQIRFGAGLVLRSFNEVGQYSFDSIKYSTTTTLV